MSYCTITQIKNNWTVPTEISDSELADLITLAEAMINKFTNDNFNENSLELIIDGSGSQVLWLAKFTSLRCLSVTSIEDTETDTEYDSDYYVVYERTIVMSQDPEIRAAGYLSGGKWVHGHKNIKITGTFGWAAVPEPIKRATILLVRMLAEGDASGKSGLKDMMKSEHIGDYSYTIHKDKNWGENVQTFTGNLEIDSILTMYLNFPIQPLDSGGDYI